MTASDLYNLNDTVTDGHTFVRDTNLLNYAVRRPKLELSGEVQFPTLIDKAAALPHSVAYHHLFADGNKRTAALRGDAVLRVNGYH
ncbi:MAG: Fic family protein [Anaerolineae bacterium]